MSLIMVPLERLRSNPRNVRENLGDLTELAASIRAKGILQPLVVSPTSGDALVVIDGHRRLEAARLAGSPAVPCIVRAGIGRDDVVTTMLAAALHKGLEPIEQANAFVALRNAGLSCGDIARQTGYSVATVSNRLILVDLPPEAQQMVQAKRLTLSDATALAKQVRARKSGSVRTNTQRQGWLTGTHRLAGNVRNGCTHQETRTQIGGVGCGQCWEAAIRADERGDGEAQIDERIDEMAVQRAVDGDRSGSLTPAERALAVEHLAGKGLSDGQIARRLGCSDRTVLRLRQARSVPAAFPRVGGAA